MRPALHRSTSLSYLLSLHPILSLFCYHDFHLGLTPPPPLHPALLHPPKTKLSHTPCPRPSPCSCLSALMLIITTEWICRFPWMSVELWPVLPLPSSSTSPASCVSPFSTQWGLRERERSKGWRGWERVLAQTPGWFDNCLIYVILPIKVDAVK